MSISFPATRADSDETQAAINPHLPASRRTQFANFYQALLVILWLVPPILIIGFYCRFAIDMPVWDDLNIGNTVHDFIVNGFTLHKLVVQHNEARPAFARLLIWLVYLPTHWDVRYWMAATFTVILSTGLLMVRICRKTIGNRSMAMTAAVFINFMLFSPVQWHNLLWGIEVISFIPALALVIVLLSLGSKCSFAVSVPIASLSAIVSTYSNANGMLVWILAVPFFLIHPSVLRLRALLVWTILAAIFIGYYFHGYVPPAVHPPMSLVLKNPKDAIGFLLSFLGNGLRFGYDIKFDEISGLVAVSALALGAAWLSILNRNLQLWRNALPWIVLGTYSIFSGILTTFGRFGFGPYAAMADRYCAFAIPLWISIVPLWIVIFNHTFAERNWLRKSTLAFAMTGGAAIALMMFQGILFIRPELMAYDAQVRAGRSVAQFMLVAPDDDAIMSTLYPNTEFVKKVIAYADKEDLFHPQCFRTSDISSIAADSGDVLSGYFDSMGYDGDSLVVNGWACLPPHKSLADAILLTTPDAAGKDRVFAIVTEDRLPRPDVAQMMNSPALGRCGWTKRIDKNRLPPGTMISAWAFDTFSRRAYRLGTTHQIP